MIQQILHAYMVAKGLNDGPTLAGVDTEGRIDVLASAAIASLVAANPILAAAHALLRPQLDGYLVEKVGPSALVSGATKYLSENDARAALAASSNLIERELNKRGVRTRSNPKRPKSSKGSGSYASQPSGRQSKATAKARLAAEAKAESRRVKTGAYQGAEAPRPSDVGGASGSSEVIDLVAQRDGTYA